MSNLALGTRPRTTHRDNQECPTGAPLQDSPENTIWRSAIGLVGTLEAELAGRSCDRNPPRLRLKTARAVL
jgi:hypothetical protein